MSATGRGGRRLAHDSYVTPSWCVDRLLDELPLPGTGIILEPCAGRGELIRAVRARTPGRQFLACELREACAAKLGAMDRVEVCTADFLKEDKIEQWVRDRKVDLVITNPPYSLAMDFIERARQLCPQAWVVYLLRLNFLASEERSSFMRSYAPDIYALPNRPSFRNGTTDATEYGWFVWRPAQRGARTAGQVRVLGTTPAEIRNPRRKRRRQSSSSGGSRLSRAA